MGCVNNKPTPRESMSKTRHPSIDLNYFDLSTVAKNDNKKKYRPPRKQSNYLHLQTPVKPPLESNEHEEYLGKEMFNFSEARSSTALRGDEKMPKVPKVNYPKLDLNVNPPSKEQVLVSN